MKLIASTIALIFVLSSIQVPPEPPQPTCDSRPEDYSAPGLPPCNGIWDYGCVQACRQAYREAVCDAANEHCQQSAINTATLQDRQAGCDAGFWDCINSGAGWTFCDGERQECRDDAQGYYDDAQAADDATLAAALGGALDDFEDCVSGCCHQQAP